MSNFRTLVVIQCSRCDSIVRRGEEYLHTCRHPGRTMDAIPENQMNMETISLYSICENFTDIRPDKTNEEHQTTLFADMNCENQRFQNHLFNRPGSGSSKQRVRRCHSLPLLCHNLPERNTIYPDNSPTNNEGVDTLHSTAHISEQNESQTDSDFPYLTFSAVNIDESQDPENCWQLATVNGSLSELEYSGPVEVCNQFTCYHWEFKPNNQIANPNQWWHMIKNYNSVTKFVAFKGKYQTNCMQPEIESRRIKLSDELGGCLVVFRISAYDRKNFKFSLLPLYDDRNNQASLRSVTIAVKLEIQKQCSHKKYLNTNSPKCGNCYIFSHAFTIRQFGEKAFPDNFLIPLGNLGI